MYLFRITKKRNFSRYIILIVSLIGLFATVYLQMKFKFITFSDPKDYSFKVLTFSSITYGLLQFGLNSSNASQKIYLGIDMIELILLDSKVIKFLYTKTYKVMFMYVTLFGLFFDTISSANKQLLSFIKYKDVVLSISNFGISLWYITIIMMMIIICLTLFKGISFIKAVFVIKNNNNRNLMWLIEKNEEEKLEKIMYISIFKGDLSYYFNYIIYSMKQIQSNERNKYLSFLKFNIASINNNTSLKNIISYYTTKKYYNNNIELYLHFVKQEYQKLFLRKKTYAIDYDGETLYFDIIKSFSSFINEIEKNSDHDDSFIDELINLYNTIENLLDKILLITFDNVDERNNFLKKNLYNEYNQYKRYRYYYNKEYIDIMNNLLILTKNPQHIKKLFDVILKSPLRLAVAKSNKSFFDNTENSFVVNPFVIQIVKLCESRNYVADEVFEIFEPINNWINSNNNWIHFLILEYCLSWDFKDDFYFPLYKLIMTNTDYLVKVSFISYIFLAGHRYDEYCNVKFDLDFLRVAMLSTKDIYRINIADISDDLKDYLSSSNVGHRFTKKDLDKLICWIGNKFLPECMDTMYDFEYLSVEESLLLKAIIDINFRNDSMLYYDFNKIKSLRENPKNIISSINYFTNDKRSELLNNDFVKDLLHHYRELYKIISSESEITTLNQYSYNYNCKLYIVLGKYFSKNEIVHNNDRMLFYNNEILKYLILNISNKEYDYIMVDVELKNIFMERVCALISLTNLNISGYIEKLFSELSVYSSFIDLSTLSKEKILLLLSKHIR